MAYCMPSRTQWHVLPTWAVGLINNFPLEEGGWWKPLAAKGMAHANISYYWLFTLWMLLLSGAHSGTFIKKQTAKCFSLYFLHWGYTEATLRTETSSSNVCCVICAQRQKKKNTTVCPDFADANNDKRFTPSVLHSLKRFDTWLIS